VTLGFAFDLGFINRSGYAASTPAFLPTYILNLSLWLDGADAGTITAVSGLVSQWDDKSGNNNHAAQGIAARQPSTGVGNIGGLNALFFSQDWMLYSEIPRQNGYTVFVVNRLDSVTVHPRAYVKGPNGSLTFRVDNTPLQSQIVRTGEAILLGGTDTPAVGIDYISSCRTGSAGSNIYVNGVDVGSNTVNPGYHANLDALGGNGIFDPLLGHIGEVLVYERILTDAEMNQVGSYLNAKWGIPWASI